MHVKERSTTSKKRSEALYTARQLQMQSEDHNQDLKGYFRFELATQRILFDIGVNK
jgi:hypothetical protein